MAEDLVPGFYQGQERQRGLKTGRVAPRDAVRPTAWSEILNDNHIEPHHPNQVWSETSDQYDPNQGALFDVNKVAPRQTTSLTNETAEAMGVPSGRVNVKGKDTMGLAAQPGFMPNLNVKQKKAALQGVATARDSNGTVTGQGHFADMMASRESAYRAVGHADWYEGTDSSGSHDGSLGHAPAIIQQTAAVHGFSTGAMTRATAISSPQATWQDDQTGEYVNVQAAKHALLSSRSAADEDDAYQKASSIRASGGVLPEAVGRAAVHNYRHGDRGGAFSVQSPLSQKTPNFEASLNLSHVDPVVRHMAAQAYAVDRHDAKVVGMDNNSKEFQRRGVYDAVAMTGRRAALRHRQLPPNEQAAEWVGQKSRSVATSDAPRLLDPNTLAINQSAVPAPPTAPSSSRTMTRDNRSPIAQKYGLDF